MKKSEIKQEAMFVLKRANNNKEKAFEMLNDVIYELASYTDENGKLIKSASDSASQIQMWASIIIYLRTH